jgi:succinyl-diaminopimelate desuccinylase
MEYYLKHDEAPTMSFSPDANYPIINGEKGILTFSLNTSFDCENSESGIKILSFERWSSP